MDPQVEQLIAQIQARPGGFADLLRADAAAARIQAAANALGAGDGGPELEVVEDRVIHGPGGELPLRVFLPADARGAYLHIHGGGWVLGSHGNQDRWLRGIAAGAGVAIASVGYRLAPEHPYPAGLDDCVTAARWLEANAADLCAEPSRLAIGGESAGANLAVATLLRLRDEDGTHPFRGAALTFGVFDAGLALPSMEEWGERELILSRPIMEAFVDHYAPEHIDHPYVSPLRADLRGMPPACFVVGDLDPLLSDSELMMEAWKRDGAPAELHRFTDGFHGFTGVPGLALGERATAELIAFLHRTIGRGGDGQGDLAPTAPTLT